MLYSWFCIKYSMKYLFNGKSIIYKVKEGDTLCSIAIKFNTTVENVCAQNGLNENIILGQTLFICPLKGKMRTVKPFEEIAGPFSRVVEL